jgi:hypothetical protein
MSKVDATICGFAKALGQYLRQVFRSKNASSTTSGASSKSDKVFKLSAVLRITSSTLRHIA